MDMFAHKTQGWIFKLLAAAFGLSLLAIPLAAQDADYEEIVVNFDIPRLLNSDIFVQYSGQTVYLPVIDIFTLLEISVDHDPESKHISGFMFSKKMEYDIDLNQNEVRTSKGLFKLNPGEFIYDGHELYLRLDLFDKFFDLPMEFDFSQLKVGLPLNKDFPAYRRLKRKKAQEKLLNQQIAEKEVYSLPFQRSYLGGAVVDWTLSANPLTLSSDGSSAPKTQFFSLNSGNMLLGGDLTLAANGDFTIGGGESTQKKFNLRKLRGHWHYFFSENKYLTQTEVGNVFAGGRLSRAVDGVLITNKPQVRRTYFQTIRLQGNLGEGWEVELYVDNKLTDFTETDASGNYDFNIDIFYGASQITLRMYGPNGEIKTEETYVRVPYNLIPQNEIEYTLAVGKASQHDTTAYYGQANCYYGVTPRVTAGLSTDVPLKTADSTKQSVAAELTVQPMTNLTFSGYASPDNSINGSINFNQPMLVSVNGGYTKFLSKNFRNLAGRESSAEISLSSPLRIAGRYLGLRFNVTVDQYPDRKDVGMYYGFSTSLPKFSINYFGRYATTNRDQVDSVGNSIDSKPIVSAFTSQLFLSTSLLRWVRPQFRIDYDHEQHKMVKYSVLFTRRLFRTGQLSLSYERNELFKQDMFRATINLYTDFAGFTSRVMANPSQVTYTQSQRGSIRYDQATGALHFNRRSGVGQGSAVLRPFLDNNSNGRYDTGDEQIRGISAKIRGSNRRMVGKDKVYYYDHLRPYDEYVVEIDEYSLDNPLLKPVHDGYRVHFNPNMVTAIEVPLVMAGELSGMVRRHTSHGDAGLGGARLKVVNLETGAVTSVTTFNNGEYYYLGLLPGHYRAQIDPEQLNGYGYNSEPEYIDFEMQSDPNGGFVEDINFLLVPR